MGNGEENTKRLTCKLFVYLIGWIGGWALSVLRPFLGLTPAFNILAANPAKIDNTSLEIKQLDVANRIIWSEFMQRLFKWMYERWIWNK